MRANLNSFLLLPDSDDTESEGEEDEWENGEPGVSPPPSLPKYDEIRFLGPTQDQHVSTGSAHGPSSVINSALLNELRCLVSCFYSNYKDYSPLLQNPLLYLQEKDYNTQPL